MILAARKRFANSDTAGAEIAEFVRGMDRLLPPLDSLDGIDQIPDLGGVEITFDPQIAEQVLLDMVDPDHNADLDRTAQRIHAGLLLLVLIKETRLNGADLDKLLTEASELANDFLEDDKS